MEIDGLVLRLIPIKEQDAMMHVLTCNGIMSIFARRVMSHKSELHEATQPFCRSSFTLSEGTQGGLRLRQAKLIQAPPLVENSLTAYATLELISETLTHLEGDVAWNDLVELTYMTLAQLRENRHIAIAAVFFLAKLLSYGGWLPEVNGCVICKAKSDIVAFDHQAGGFVCRKHYNPETSTIINQEISRAIRVVFSAPSLQIALPYLDDKLTEPLLNLLGAYYHMHLGRELRSIRMILASIH